MFRSEPRLTKDIRTIQQTYIAPPPTKYTPVFDLVKHKTIMKAELRDPEELVSLLKNAQARRDKNNTDSICSKGAS